MSKTTARIHMLPPQLANQIAAGEVIERPASVVKELLENSLDAGATEISIDLVDGGISQIQVKDNGCGIHPDDMLLALSQHATSKITNSDDLSQIMTLGFRGEALASISAVSQLSLTAAQADSAHAWQVQVAGREALRALPAAHPVGCSVEVRELFYNTPARRKFLRSARTEWQYTEEIIKRILLSRFDVGFILTHNEKKWRYPAILGNDVSARIAKVFSPAFMQVAQVVDVQALDAQLTGFVAPHDFSRSSHDWQYFYVNGRMVKDKLLQHAMRQAYADRLHPGRYAAYVLYLTLDPTQVDVNVHPTKHEVRFQQTRWIHDFIVSSVQAALASAPSVEETPRPYASAKFYSHNTLSVQNSGADTTRKLGTYLTVLNQQVIITQTTEGLGIVDLHAYYAYQAQCLIESSTRHPLLTPQRFKVSLKQDSLLLAQQAVLNTLGFTIDQLAEGNWVLREIPAVFNQADMTQLFNALCVGLTHEDLIQHIVCAAFPHAGLHLSPAEIERILDNVESLPAQACCPHGFKVWQLCSLADLREALCKHP